MTGFSGTTAECLADFGTRYSGMEGRKLLANFCKVVVHPTTREWTSGERVPKGEPLLRVRCFLSLAGYTVSEFEELPDVAQQFMLLLATDVVKVEDAQRELGYKDIKGLYDITLRGKSPLRDKVFRLEQLVRQRADTLRGVSDKWRSDIAAVLSGAKASDEVRGGSDLAVEQTPERSVEPVPRVSDEQAPPALVTRSDEGPDASTALIVAHLIQAMDTAMSGTADVPTLAALVRSRVSHKRLRAVRAFLDQVLAKQD
jgi:hypothetical protein